MVSKFTIKNPRLEENDNYLVGNVDYHFNKIIEINNRADTKSSSKTSINSHISYNKSYEIVPTTLKLEFKTQKAIPKVGVMMVGIGGNNGSTFTGVILANRHNIHWETKKGTMAPNYYGSIIKSSTIPLGTIPTPDETNTARELCVPMCDLVPILDPNQIEIDGWDISSVNMADAMKRSQVFEVDLQNKLYPLMKEMKPRKSIFNVEFVAANQRDRADNVLTGSWLQQIEAIRADIRDFKQKKQLDSVIVMWTASTERFSDVIAGINDTAENLMRTVSMDNPTNVAPSTMFGIASILEGCSFINGSPQNTLVPGLVELAKQHNVHLAGDDFKTGQTKIKSALVEFLVNSGIKPVSIVSYNHLGNNDGRNLNAPPQFRSKEITKSGVIEDMISANDVLYSPGEKPDHCIVIKYVPYVGDSKRALDEYTSEICMHGLNTLVIHNTCEDSLLAATVMLDLILLCEFLQRVTIRVQSHSSIQHNGITDEKIVSDFYGFDTIYSALSVLLKSPCTSLGEPSINAFSRQRNSVENLFRACVGLPPNSHMLLEHRIPYLSQFLRK